MSNNYTSARCDRCGDAVVRSAMTGKVKKSRVRCVGCERAPSQCDCPKDARRGA